MNCCDCSLETNPGKSGGTLWFIEKEVVGPFRSPEGKGNQSRIDQIEALKKLKDVAV